MIPPVLDEFGREVEKEIDTWQPRRGVALAIKEIAPLMSSEHTGYIFDFFVNSSLGDRDTVVRTEMLNAALKIVDLHGKVNKYIQTFTYDLRKSLLLSPYFLLKQ